MSRFSQDVDTILKFAGDSSNIDAICDDFRLIDPFSDTLCKEENILDSIERLLKNQKRGTNKMSSSGKSKHVMIAGWNSFRRTISFSDLFTDGYLLYLVSNMQMMLFSILLSISIICPYVVSYSCGIKLFFTNRGGGANNKSHSKNVNRNRTRKIGNSGISSNKGLKKFLDYLGISPIGVLYFIFLDLIDVLFSYYRLIVIILFDKTELEMKLLEETVSNQLGMSTMDYEGMKRQRCVSQIMFEAIPQTVLQSLLAFGIFNTKQTNIENKADIDELSVYTSIFFALLNSIFQILRLRAESQAVREPFFQYCSQCLMARISWIPFKNEIASYLAGDVDNYNDNYKLDKYISYDIKV